MDHAIGLKYSNNGFKFYLEEVFRWVNESIFMVVQTELLAGAYYGIKITDKAVLETGAEVTFEGADFSILIEPEIALKYKF